MKRAIALIFMLAAVALALLGPFNILNGINNLNSLKTAVYEYSDIRSSIAASQRNVYTAQSAFEEGRTFNVDYKNIDQIVEILDNITSISVSSINAVDAQQYFTPIGLYEEGVQPTAVKISMVAEDPVAALGVLDKMELPVYEVFISNPNLVDVTFLTGGTIK